MARGVRTRIPVASHDLDVPALFGVLAQHRVRFVVIGGIAANMLGSTTVTRDLDICYAREPADLEALAGALRELSVTLRGAEADLPFKLDARTLRSGLNFTFRSALGDFDCIGEASGVFTYVSLAPNAETVTVDGRDIAVASLDDLIRMKRAAGRIKDLIEVENLSALREVREGRPEE